MTDPQHEDVLSALNTFIDEAIVRPDAAQRPGWASDRRFGLLFHLKSFMWGYHETLLRNIWNNVQKQPTLMKKIQVGGLSAAGLVAATMPLAMLGYETRRRIGYWGTPPAHTELDGFEYFYELGQRSGYLGFFQLYADADQAEDFGRFSLLSVMGPTASMIEEFVTKDMDYFLPRAVPLLAQMPAARGWVTDAL